MSVDIPSVNTASGGDTWQNALDKLNDVISTLNQNTVTVDQTANGSVSSGNGYVDGVLGVANLQVSFLGGGNTQSSANLQIVSNVSFVSSITVSMGPYQLTTGLLKMGANVQISNTGWLIGNSSVNAFANSSTLSMSGKATINSFGFFIGGSSISNTQVTANTGQFDTIQANVISANTFSGNGINFSTLGANVLSSNTAIIGNGAVTNLSSNVFTANTANLISAQVSGTLTVNNFVANTYSGNGAGMTGVLKVSSNLTDLGNVVAARAALQLGSAALSNTTAFQANLGYTPVNKAGDTVTGALMVQGNFVASGSTVTAANTDFYTYQPGGTTGIVRLNSSGTRYLLWDGTAYNLTGAHLNTAAGRVWGSGDFSDYPITSMRLSYAGDVTIKIDGTTDTRDTWAGSVVTGSQYTAVYSPPGPYSAPSSGPNPLIERRRYMQVYKQSTGWFTISYT